MGLDPNSLPDRVLNKVNPLSAKADSFFGQGAYRHPYDRRARSEPGNASARQYVPRSVDISMQSQSTGVASVYANAQFFKDCCATPAAFLARAFRIDFYYLNRSVFSFRFKNRDKLVPPSITDRSGKPVVPDHSSNVQAFNRNHTVAIQQKICRFVSMLSAQVRYVSMPFAKPFNCLSAISSALLLSANRPAATPQSGEIGTKKFRIGDVPSVRRGQEVFKSDINTDGRIDIAKLRRSRQCSGSDHKPFIGFTLERKRLDFALNRPVQFNSDDADVLHAQPVISQSGPVAVTREGERIEPVSRFKPWVTRLFTSFNPAKESLKGAVKTAESCLGAGKVNPLKPRIFGPLCFVPSRLLTVVNIDLKLFPAFLALNKCSVVKPAVRFQSDRKLALLVSVCPQPKLIGFVSHLLRSFLGFNVTLDCCLAHSSDRPSVVTAAPKSGKPGFEPRKFVTQDVAGIAFEPVSNFGNRVDRLAFNEKVDVVRHDHQVVDGQIQFTAFLPNQFFKPRSYFLGQNRISIFRAPDQVKLETENRAGVSSIPFHGLDIRQINNHVKRYSPAIPPLPKGSGSLAKETFLAIWA